VNGVGFWRALFEVVLLGIMLEAVATALGLSFTTRVLCGYAGYAAYVFAAWRLRPGAGPPTRRIARLILWIALASLGYAACSWIELQYSGPPQDRLLGLDTGYLASVPPTTYVVNSCIVILCVFLPARLLADCWRAGRTRLRWQLTFSYLLIGMVTTILIPLVGNAYVAVVSLWVAPPLIAPMDAARDISARISPLLSKDLPAERLDAVLNDFLAGSIRLPIQGAAEPDRNQVHFSLNGVRRILVLKPDGEVIAAAGKDVPQSGRALPAADAARLALVLSATPPNGGCTGGRPFEGPNADCAACGIVTGSGRRPSAILVVENDTSMMAEDLAAINRVAAYVILGAVSGLPLLLLTVLVVLALAGGIGAFLAGRLTVRLERLARATNEVSNGEFVGPVDVVAADEVGQLAAGFNQMVVQLQEREAALSGARERAETLLGVNRRLVADVSHELRTPLATLRGYLDLVTHEHGSKLPADDLAALHGEVERLTTLVEDLFALTRVEAKQLSLHIEPVDLCALIVRLVDMLGPLARREHEIELIHSVSDDLPPVLADSARLEQVIRNLLQNALRYTPAGGIVAIEASVGTQTVTLTVADTGIGIAPDVLPHVFERFFRGDDSRTRQTGGAGLGLALVQELTTAMGGSVAAESVPGEGSRFRVTLRRADLSDEA
jgi:signal transduction histidine kinase